MTQTQPRLSFLRNAKPDPAMLAAGRYGTPEMCQIWGPENTMALQLYVQGVAAVSLSNLDPEIVPGELAREIADRATLEHVKPDKIREIEARTGHDIIGVNTALEEVLSEAARVHVNKAKTSADTTQPARALQLKKSLEVVADTIENLRDITLERAVGWINIPYMDGTHGFDALPTVAGRPFTHYAEMLQSGLDLLKFVYIHSIMGKWADATGNHHSATVLGISGMNLEGDYCNRLGVGHMIAPAQLPGLEFEADVFFVLSRFTETMNNIANYLHWGKSQDVDLFSDTKSGRKGSSAMPHKDVKGGNPTAEEQVMSLRRYMQGNLVTAVSNSEMRYARDLAASANSRINFEDGFKFFDHAARSLASAVYHLGINEARSQERIERTYGITTSQQVMMILTDPRRVEEPMARSIAHDLMGELATRAYTTRTPFIDVLLQNEDVTSRISSEQLRGLTDPIQYIGQSKEIIGRVFENYHHQRTLK